MKPWNNHTGYEYEVPNNSRIVEVMRATGRGLAFYSWVDDCGKGWSETDGMKIDDGDIFCWRERP